MTPPAAATQIGNLQALRAFAVLIVILYHALGTAWHYGFQPFLLAPLTEWGINGLDIFFVLAGFLAIVATHHRPKEPGVFILARVLRIVPLYWVLTLAFAMLLVVMPDALNGAAFGADHLLASLFLVTGPMGFDDPLLTVGWTLKYAMAFFALFALSLFIPRPLPRCGVLSVALLGCAGLTGTIDFGAEVVLGMLAGLFFVRRDAPRAVFATVAAAGILAFLATAFVAPAWPDWILYGLPAVAMVWGLSGCRDFAGRLPRLLGDASYSLYLVQAITIPLWYKAAGALPLNAAGGDLLVLGAVGFTAICGLVVHRAIERPVIRLSDRVVLQGIGARRRAVG